MRRAGIAAAISLLILGLLASPASAKGDLAAQVKVARERANAAAARLAKASDALAAARRDIDNLRTRQAAARQKVDSLEGRVRALAVDRYISGATMAPTLSGDPSAVARGDALLRWMTIGSTDDLDAYRVARDDLDASSSALEARLAQRTKAVAELQKVRAQTDAELDRLAKALRALEARQRAERNRTASASRSSGGGGGRVTGVIASGNWVCPVQGPRAFADTWGAARSGGRRHQGVDIMSPRGTPVVASVAGTVRHHNSRLGGLSYYLRGDDGNTYFGTHLSGYAASGRVAAGTVVGYVGDTGNARGSSPHLHFEIHPGGGRPVNPYPTVARFC